MTETQADFPAITFFSLKNPQQNVPLKEIMMMCRFNLQTCNENDFDTLIDRFGFVSYRLKNKVSYIEGMIYGLEVILYNEKYNEQMNNFSISNGLQIIVHNRSVYPQYSYGTSNRGVYAAAGLATSISLSKMFSF